MFGTDGIRGFPNQGYFIKKNLIKIGYSYGCFLKKASSTLNIFISKDTRKSSDFIESNLIKGLNQAGLNTISLGILPTSSLSIFTEKYPYSAGIMITASHNGHEYCGIKFINLNGEKISSRDEKEIELLFKRKKIKKNIDVKNIKYHDAISEYVNEITDKIPCSPPSLKYCVDVSNGASYKATSMILKKLGHNFSIISNKPNGENINRRCGVENLSKISKYIIKNKLDFGVAIDGDADRIVFIDKNGEPIQGDKIITFLGLNILKKGSKLVTTIMTNSAIEDSLKKNNIQIIRTDVGDKKVYEMMKKTKSIFGGENSGHYIIKSFLNTSDSNLTLLFVLSLLNRKNLKFDYFDKIKLNPSQLKSFTVKSKKPLDKINDLEIFKKSFKSKYKSKGYLNIRYSGTENKIRILIQGLNLKDSDNEINEFENIIKEIQ